VATGYLLTWTSLAWLWLATAGFVLHWFGDSLDGTLARERGIGRERYGFYVDHQSDAVSAFLIFVPLGLSPLMPLAVALFLLVGYYLMMIMVSLVTITRDVFKISFSGAGPTEARLAMIAANTAVFFSDNYTIAISGLELSLFTMIGGLGAVILICFYISFSLIERAKLSVQDPTPVSRPSQFMEHDVQPNDIGEDVPVLDVREQEPASTASL